MNNEIPEWLQKYLPFLKDFLLAVIILLVGWLLSKWAKVVFNKIGRKRKLDEAVLGFLSSIISYSVLIAAIIASLGTVGIETTSLVAIFASAGLAVGLALQGNLSNFSSGVMILIFRPITLGDKIKVDGIVGDVTDIGLFTTTMSTFENEKVIVPNATVTGGTIINFTQPGVLRGGVDVGIAYGSDVSLALEVMLNAAKRATHVLDDPAPHVAFVGLGSSSLDFTVYAWCNSSDYRDMFHAVRSAVYEDLCTAGIEIPFAQVVVHKSES